MRAAPPGTFFYAAVVADFNKDGKPDLAVLEYPTNAPGGFFLLINNGDGTFATTATTVLQNGAQIILAGDFNGDGKMDIAAIGSSIEVFPGDGTGGFGAGISTTLSQTPASAVAADFTGNHKLDLAFGTDSLNANSLFLYTGNGDGTFAAGVTISVPGPAVGLAAADLNGGHKIDLLATISGISAVAGGVDVLIGNGDGTFLSPVAYPIPRSYSTSTQLFDHFPGRCRWQRTDRCDSWIGGQRPVWRRRLGSLRQWRWYVSAGRQFRARHSSGDAGCG